MEEWNLDFDEVEYGLAALYPREYRVEKTVDGEKQPEQSVEWRILLEELKENENSRTLDNGDGSEYKLFAGNGEVVIEAEYGHVLDLNATSDDSSNVFVDVAYVITASDVEESEMKNMRETIDYRRQNF